MDYERIELLSKKLSNARADVRLRTASNLLFKLERGIFDKEAVVHSTSMLNLLDGIYKSLAIIIKSPKDLENIGTESYQLLSLLLSILKALVLNPAREIAAEPTAKILEQIYQIKALENIDGKLSKLLDEVFVFLFN
jgi:hypothetical protein